MKPRYELRYFVSPESALQIRDFVREYLDFDEHSVGKPNFTCPVHTLHLDSNDWKVCWWTGSRRSGPLKAAGFGCICVLQANREATGIRMACVRREDLIAHHTGLARDVSKLMRAKGIAAGLSMSRGTRGANGAVARAHAPSAGASALLGKVIL